MGPLSLALLQPGSALVLDSSHLPAIKVEEVYLSNGDTNPMAATSHRGEADSLYASAPQTISRVRQKV